MQSVAKKHRKIILITIAIIIVAGIVSASGYMYWNNSQKQKMPSLQQTALDRKANQEKEKSDEARSASEESNEGYLVLKDWGVKLKIPDGMGEVVYYKEDLRNSIGPSKNEVIERYEFTTKRLEALGGQCVDSPDGAEAVRLGVIGRSKTKPESEVSGPAYLNNGQPIDGYYYSVGYAQAACSMKDLNIQAQDRKLVGELLQSIVAL